MVFYVRYLDSIQRGEFKIISEGDFRSPPVVETPEEVNRNKKYKVLGGEEKGMFVNCAIIKVSGNKLKFVIC